MLGGVDDHLVGAARPGCDANRSGSPARVEAPQRVDRARQARSRPPAAGGSVPARRVLVRRDGGEHRIEVRHRPRRPARASPARRRRTARPDLGRGAVLAALAERAGLERRPLGALSRRRGEGVRALGPARREDRAQAGELVDADLGGAHRGLLGRALAGIRPARGRRAGRRPPASKPQERLDHVERQREDDRRVLVDADVEQRLQVAELEGRRVEADDVGGLGELLRRPGTRRRRR